MLPSHNTLLIAESFQGQIIACHIPTQKVSTWLQHELLSKVTTRPPWPGVNGIQFFRGKIYCTNSDRGYVVRLDVDEHGEYRERSAKVLVEDLCGDDLAFDQEGNAYIATNPQQTVMKIARLGMEVGEREDLGRVTILGGPEVAESAGPTAVAFGRGEERKMLYIVTNGGMVNAVGGKVVEAKVVRVDVGILPR